MSGVISWRRVGKNGMKLKILYGAVATVVIVVAAAAMAAGQSSSPARDSVAKDLLSCSPAPCAQPAMKFP